MGRETADAPLIVERDRELTALARALVQSREGKSSVVLLVGEPGLGKSHLLRSFSAEGDTLVLRGYSLEADAPPYFPFRRALARSVRELPRLGPISAGVLQSFGIIPSQAQVPAEVTAAEPLAIQDALTELLVGLAEESPVVLVLDDMQWASAASWEAVTYLARAAEGSRIAVILATRPEGIDPPAPGASATSELNRNGLLHLLPLRPLSESGTEVIASRTLGAAPSRGLVETLSARTGGNPFFLQEVLRSLSESGQLVSTPAGLALPSTTGVIPVPDTLRLAIWQRVSRLPEATVKALQAAAVVGRVFDLEFVSAMLEQPPDWVSARLRPAARASIVSEESPGRWAFVHDTLREGVLAQIEDQRRARHRDAARVFSLRVDAPSELETAAAIAFHLREAGDSQAAIPASIHASSLALAAHGADQALELATVAETLFENSTIRPAHLAPRDIHRAVALAADAAAAYERAEAAWAAVLDDTADPAERARILVNLATVARKAERSDAAADYFERALALLETGSDSRTLVGALVELSTLEGTTRSDYEAAILHGERALALASEMNEAGLQARAGLALANARARNETPAAARAMLRFSLDKAMEANDLFVAAEAAASLSNSYYWTGEPREAFNYAQRRLEIAERGRDAFALRHAYSWLALLATTVGDWDKARTMIGMAEPAIARLGSPEPLGFLRVVEAMLASRTGDVELALARSEEAMRILVPLGDATASWYVAVRIWSLIMAGRLDEAAHECQLQEARLTGMPDQALPARSARCGLARAYVVLGDRVRGLACEEKLAPFVDDFHWRPARESLAGLAALRGDRQRALALLREVEAQDERNGMDHDVSETRRIISLLERGEKAEVAFGPRSGTAPKHTPGGLSPRENEVLVLVARGMSNREIAEHLVLSERTVVNHVSHIFEKIGVENRAGATAFAFRNGLAKPG